jgi:hypothetical protein
METRFKKLLTLIKCSKLEVIDGITQLFSAIFSNNGLQHLLEWVQHKNLIGLDIVQDLQAFSFHDFPQLSQFQMPL